MARILVADQIAPQGIELLQEHHDVTVQTGLSEDELVEAVAGVSGLLVRSQTRVTARVIEAAPHLEVIGRAGVGVDNIDIDAATAHGVIVVNAPLANTLSATEHAFALMLAVARNVPRGDATLREGRWERGRLQGVELAGHTLGVVGLGRIGSEVAHRARAFEMRVIAFDPFVSTERATSMGVELCSLEELLAQADFVTLHTALHEGTRGMLGAEQLALMKPSAYVVNTARGALIDEQALHDAVSAGRLAGAAIDVFSEEPAIGNVLTTSDRIVVTPHLAASTAEAQDRAAVDTVEQVLDVLDGRPARFAVNAPLVDPETMAVIGPYIDAAEVAASVASQLEDGQLEGMRIEYLGEIANHEVGPLRASAIVGVLERASVAKVTIVNADQLAAEHGIRVDEDRGLAREPYANLIVVHVRSQNGETRIAATHTPQGVRIVGLDDYEVEIEPGAAPYVLAIENLDRPGMIGRVGGLLGEWSVNVNFMSVAGGPEGRALMALGIGRALDAGERDQLGAIDDIFRVRVIDLT
jgi:D-3-phosphoglycerate dehydrogenase